MPRMRTHAEAYQMLINDDPDTAITKNALRTFILSGQIPSVQVGRKRLIDYDKMVEMINNPPVHTEVQADYGKIRRIG